MRAAAGAPEGLWLRAARQWAGKGRLGRTWDSRIGNFHASTIVRLQPGDPVATTLALAAGLALHGCAQSTGAQAPLTLKWPNDLMAGSAKLAGILMERAGDAVVIGFGINLAFAPVLPERETAALVDLGADPRIDADILVRDLAACFSAALAVWRRGGAAMIIEEWMARAHPVGTLLSATSSDGSRVTGTFLGIAPDGALRLQSGEGPPIEVRAGDIDLS